MEVHPCYFLLLSSSEVQHKRAVKSAKGCLSCHRAGVSAFCCGLLLSSSKSVVVVVVVVIVVVAVAAAVVVVYHIFLLYVSAWGLAHCVGSFPTSLSGK